MLNVCIHLYIYTNVHTHTGAAALLEEAGCVRHGDSKVKNNLAATRRPKPIGCFIFIGHFPRKSLVFSGSFAENDMQFKAFYGCLPPCEAF